jgi:glycine/D-amino acid oxidase-like deaminating enzyme
VVGDEATDRYGVDVASGILIDTEERKDLASLSEAPTYEAAIRSPDNMRTDAVALVFNLAHYLFEHVLECDDSLSTAIFVDNDSHMPTLLLEYT